MSEDGTIDFSRYSREELLQALDHIDGARFPINLGNARKELESRPVVPPPRVMTKHERAAAAVEMDISWALILGYTALSLVLSFGFELATQLAISSEGLQGLWSLLPAFCLNLVFAKRHPRGYYINASLVVISAIAFWTVFSPSGSAAVSARAALTFLFWSLCTVSVAGLLCGLWPSMDRQDAEDA